MKEDVHIKKDRQALMVIYAALLEEILEQLDDEITTKETWEVLQKKFVGVDCVKNSMIQSLKKEFDHIFMGNEESVGDFTGRFSSIITKLEPLERKLRKRKLFPSYFVQHRRGLTNLLPPWKNLVALTTCRLKKALDR